MRAIFLALTVLSLQVSARGPEMSPFLTLIADVFPLQMPSQDMPDLVPSSCAVGSGLEFQGRHVGSMTIEIRHINANNEKVSRTGSLTVQRSDEVQIKERSTDQYQIREFAVTPKVGDPSKVVICRTSDGSGGSLTLITSKGPIECTYGLAGKTPTANACKVNLD